MSHLPWLILVVTYGACVGSFLNVVIYRLPLGLSLVRPPSHCPRCGHKLAWYDNIPVFGWLFLAGRCRYCRAPVSPQYPLVELLTAVLFGLLYHAYYIARVVPPFDELGVSFLSTWPVFLVHAVLLASLLAATVIDARQFIIPLGITWTLSLVALLVLPLSHFLAADAFTVIHRQNAMYSDYLGAIGGGVVGLAVAVVLLKTRLIPQSFAEGGEASGAAPVADPLPSPADVVPPAEAVPPAPYSLVTVGAIAAGVAVAVVVSCLGGAPGATAGMVLLWTALMVVAMAFDQAMTSEDAAEAFESHSPRREVLKELLFVGWPVVGALIGDALFDPQWVKRLAAYPEWQSVILTTGWVAGGYLVGGAMVWATRILGTLAFGREAMGLGDVHLLAAIGAALGWKFAFLTFFVAPFLGLIGAVVLLGMTRLLKGRHRMIPYGPYLAAAAAALLIAGRPLLEMLGLGG